MRFEIYPRPDGRTGFRLEGNNGETVLQSEGYHGEGNARRAIKAVKAAVKDAPIVMVVAVAEEKAGG